MANVTRNNPTCGRLLLPLVLTAGLAVMVAACGSSSGSAARSSTQATSSTKVPSTTSVSSATTSKIVATSAFATTPRSGWSLSDVRHVFVIVLENEDEKTAFGTPSNDPYLARTLLRQGAFLPNYYGIGHHSADNYIGLISGQPPNEDTQDDCGIFANFTSKKTLAGGIQDGDGCVYPAKVSNLATQLSTAGFTWKAYEQDMGNIASRESAACGRPTIGRPDHTELAVAGDGYAARHDPFVYFHSIIDRAAYCDDHVVALGSPTGAMPKSARKGETGLATDLKSLSTTKNFSFITPNLCNDGHDYPCKNQASGASLWADIDGFLATWVPKIEASAAFHHGGLLMITFDESEGTFTDSSACCKERPDPGAVPPVPPGINGPGGGKIGALLISPYIRPGTVDSTAYNHYSALATFETIFGLGRLGDAAGVPAIVGSKIFNRT